MVCVGIGEEMEKKHILNALLYVRTVTHRICALMTVLLKGVQPENV